MIRVSEHRFRDASQLTNTTIYISEVIEEDYGLYIWPSSIVLAEYIWQQKDRFAGVQVLELGAGTGLPGIVAAKLGAHVILTDVENNSKVFENASRNCEQNAVDCKILGLTWGDWDSSTLDIKPDIVLGADVLYNASDFDDLFATVASLLQKKPEAVFITAYEPRSGHRSIEFLMVKWKLQCIKLLDAHEILPPEKLSLISSSIEIVEIKTL
ncbi:hypothetical protein GOP47_0009254 [Adiantum capillus-veneris]|uniref:Methyltransferase-like protein 23 n=1 Tax=Adiantum capillus-veneris TaxID=13818 RepID=A0A9D4UW87_ADICA|nr:hypothetical protein GOP47_0009254 [Adiantum capillus-veneris]